MPEIATCPSCSQEIDITGIAVGTQIECPSCAHLFSVSRMFHNYRLEQQLGEGGMGVVYQATDTNLGRTVAIKVLKEELSSDKKFITNFLREVEITASLAHPNIVQVFAFGEFENQYYLVMEHIGHRTFDDEIAERGKMTETEIIDVGIGVANGLHFALQHGGLIHRDIKPGNILFGADRCPKVVDFGLAMTPETADSSDGEIWGTPYYVSPERLEQVPEDFRSDMYSLGISLYHSLAGRPPFDAKTAELVAAKHLSDTPLPLKTYAPHVSDHTTYAIMKTMARKPEDRFQSYPEFIEQLEDAKRRLAESSMIPSASPSSTYAIVDEESVDKKKMALIIGAIVLVVLLGVGSLIGWQYFKAI